MSVLFSVPSAPVVRIESAGESTAAVNHTLTCTVTSEQDLRSPLLIQWTAPNGSIIGNETLVDVTVSRSSNNLSLTFAPLHTSHGGQYSCMASVNVPEANVFLSRQASHNITVQYPHLVITRSILTDECITNEVVTLTSNVTLTPIPSGNPTFSYTWQVPSGQNISTTTGDYTVNQGSLRVGNNTGRYTLHVCVNIPETGVVNLCNTISFTLSSIGTKVITIHFAIIIIIPAEPGQVTGLVCSSSGGSVLSFNWGPPSLHADSVIDYVVEVTEYVQPESAVKRVITRPLTPPFSKNVKSGTPVLLRAVVDSGVGECTVPLTLIHCSDVFL